MTALSEIQRRRTFAIISHPDAGKTTLTEKLLLYGGAVRLAGSVTARKNQRATTSDWMELEKQRGISVSSTVLQFEYGGCVINLLDTPGHKDFSEDTYRVLTAVGAAIMVIDSVNGIESQTRKLFEVCRRRGVPILTFMNKLDRPGRLPLELLDELETVLGIDACALNWPLGVGADFRGVFDRRDSSVHLFQRTSRGAYRAPERVGGLADDFVKEHVDESALKQSMEELAMLDGAGHAVDRDLIDQGRLTPVCFGSASNNFGVQLLLDAFLEMASPPSPRMAGERLVEPSAPGFSAFIFKIQANMDPRHRDRIYFIRIVSGAFRRDMVVQNPRTGRSVRLANSQRLFARERQTVDAAYAGDVVGIVGNHDLRIGDTLSEMPGVVFDEPRRTTDVLAEKALDFIAASNGKPFVLQVSHAAVHIPLSTTPELLAKYQAKKPMPGYPSNPAYAGLLEELDQSVGRIVGAVDRAGLSENTLILFVSDNGGLEHEQSGRIVTSNKPLRGEKGTLYEGGIRVPAIARWSGRVPAASECTTTAITTDVYPTFLELAAASAAKSQPQDGVSLATLLTNPAAPLKRDTLHWHLPHYHHSTPASAIRSGDWKLIEFFEDGALELYDLRADPSEATNLAAREPARAKELQAALAAWRQQVSARMPVTNPNYDPARASEMAKGKNADQ